MSMTEFEQRTPFLARGSFVLDTRVAYSKMRICLTSRISRTRLIDQLNGDTRHLDYEDITFSFEIWSTCLDRRRQLGYAKNSKWAL